MYAKLRFTSGWSTGQVNDAILTLLSTNTSYTLSTMVAACAATQPKLDMANSALSYAIGGHGWTQEYLNNTTANRLAVLSSPCASSSKKKYIVTSYANNLLQITLGESWVSANTLNNPTTPTANSWLNTANTPTSGGLDVYLFVSNRFIFLATAVAASTNLALSAGVFEFVKNDGFYTETSSYIPAAQFNSQLTNASLFNGALSPFVLPRFYSIRNSADRITGNATALWETPYVDDSGIPNTNLGYDFLGTATNWSPLLMPFGCSNRANLGFMGGAISDLSNVYLGPGNLGACFDEVIVGPTTFVQIDLGLAPASYGRMFFPKG